MLYVLDDVACISPQAINSHPHTVTLLTTIDI